MHILIATDASWVVDEVTAALGGPDISFTVVKEGRSVSEAIDERTPDLAILDFQIGTMGGMAITMQLRNAESVGEIGTPIPVLMLLDRTADVFLATRSGADGWLIKPLDALRLQRAADAVVSGGSYFEGVPAPADEADSDDEADSPEEVPTTAG